MVVVVLLLLLLRNTGFCQYSVTEIITDYNGYWKTSATSINAIKPGNSHNLVSFSFNGSRYSTGVNDALLTSQGQAFIAGDFRALPVTSVSGTVTSNTKIGLGYLYDGVDNGPPATPPVNSIPYYLTDGIRGLDLGTCVANLPAGNMLFPVSKINANAVNDGIPDIVITQIADPSGSQDRYEFTDINGNRVGNYVDIVLTNIAPVGNWTADFYEASKNPMTLSGGYTKTDRPVRLWAADLNAFGINNGNAANVAYFRNLSGNSDVAFVAYNNKAINLFNALLPVTLTGFSGKQSGSQIKLDWSTGAEINSAFFVIEKSADGAFFSALASIKASANSSSTLYYSGIDANPQAGNNYYRLKMVDKDGKLTYSAIIVVNATVNSNASISVYPNPAKNYMVVNHPLAGNNEQLQLVNMLGIVVLQQKINPASYQTTIHLPAIERGIYQLLWLNGVENSARRLIIQ